MTQSCGIHVRGRSTPETRRRCGPERVYLAYRRLATGHLDECTGGTHEMAMTTQDRPRVEGFYFQLRAAVASNDPLGAIEDKVGRQAFDAFAWQVAMGARGATAIAMPKEVPTLRQMSAHRTELSRRTAGLRLGPVYEIANGPEEEPPDAAGTLWLAAPPEPAFDWFWPEADRLPPGAYAGAPTIRIAHLDTGISAHPSLTDHYDAASGINPVDFPDNPTGRAVICWGRPWVWIWSTTGRGLRR